MILEYVTLFYIIYLGNATKVENEENIHVQKLDLEFLAKRILASRSFVTFGEALKRFVKIFHEVYIELSAYFC